MAVKKNQVFLISGQLSENTNGIQKLIPVIEQRVVIAMDERAAYRLLAEKEASFIASGHASLQDYENAAAKLRLALKGEVTEWTVLIAPEMI